VVKGNEITAIARDTKVANAKVSFKLAPGRTPKEIDITYLDGASKGQTAKGIYTIEGRTLRICFAGFADSARPKEFNAPAGSGFTLIDLEKDAFTAWGKEVGGLQAGLGFRAGEPRAYHHGDTVKLVVRIRNVGKEEVKFRYVRQYFIENPPAVTDGEGKSVPLPHASVFGFPLLDVKLAPGKEIELAELKLEPRLPSQSVHEGDWVLHGTGKFIVQYEQLVEPDNDKTLSKLATGKLDLEITSEPPAAAPGKEAPQKQDRDDANMKPIKIGVYIEKVNIDTSTITASCVLIGDFDNVTKPLRFENLQVAVKARITDRGKEVKLADLQLLPRDTPFYLFLKAYEFGGFEVVGIETIRK